MFVEKYLDCWATIPQQHVVEQPMLSLQGQFRISSAAAGEPGISAGDATA